MKKSIGFGVTLLGVMLLASCGGNSNGDTPLARVDKPFFDIPQATYTSPQKVSIASNTNGATIVYTTNGSDPSTTFGAIYAAPVTISANSTLKAIAFKGGMDTSSIESSSYKIISVAFTSFPDTGQTACYNEVGDVIPCPSTGQDAEFSVNPMNFVSNSNGTITDATTGLIWQTGDIDTSVNWPTAVTYCENLTLGGSSDWRLPNTNELYSIVKFGGTTGYFDLTAFSTTKDIYYWSSDTFNSLPTSSWAVNYKTGIECWSDKKTEYFFVKCVR